MTTYIVVVPPSVRVGMPVIGVPAVRTIYTAILLRWRRRHRDHHCHVGFGLVLHLRAPFTPPRSVNRRPRAFISRLWSEQKAAFTNSSGLLAAFAEFHPSTRFALRVQPDARHIGGAELEIFNRVSRLILSPLLDIEILLRVMVLCFLTARCDAQPERPER